MIRLQVTVDLDLDDLEAAKRDLTFLLLRHDYELVEGVAWDITTVGGAVESPIDVEAALS